jgi:hypothetical protein
MRDHFGFIEKNVKALIAKINHEIMALSGIVAIFRADFPRIYMYKSF